MSVPGVRVDPLLNRGIIRPWKIVWRIASHRVLYRELLKHHCWISLLNKWAFNKFCNNFIIPKPLNVASLKNTSALWDTVQEVQNPDFQEGFTVVVYSKKNFWAYTNDQFIFILYFEILYFILLKANLCWNLSSTHIDGFDIHRFSYRKRVLTMSIVGKSVNFRGSPKYPEKYLSSP